MSETPTAPAPAPALLDGRWVPWMPAIATALLFAGILLPRVRADSGLLWSVFAAGALGGGWVVGVVVKARSAGRDLEIQWWPRMPHLLQILAHGIVYAYWAWHWAPTAEQLWLIALQIPFAYLMEMGFGWMRHGRFRFGFSPIPIVGSINLFLWMTDALFGVQFLMITLAYASREYLQWTRGGRRRHIFNPSAIVLVAVSAVLIATDSTTLARGEEIAVSLGAGPLCYLSIFVAGLIVQVRFPVVLVTLSAAVVNLLLGAAWHAATGTWYYIDTAIPIAVFLGMTLLVTDPATSPNNSMGRVIFGAAYGVSVFALYTGLTWIGGGAWSEDITYFDKLLAVPLLNLLSPWMERLGAWLTPGKLAGRLSPARWNWVHVAAWVLIFFAARPSLREGEGRAIQPWVDACKAEVSGACHRLGRVYDNRCVVIDPPAGCEEAAPLVLPEACASGLPLACGLYGRMLALGAPGIPADPPASVEPLKKACDGGRADACGQLGLMAWKGHGLDIDTDYADTLLLEACDGGIAISCEHLGMMLDEVGPNGERYRAVLLLERACNGGRLVACATAGEWFATGKGVHVRMRQARSLLGRACKGGLEPACARLEELKNK